MVNQVLKNEPIVARGASASGSAEAEQSPAVASGDEAKLVGTTQDEFDEALYKASAKLDDMAALARRERKEGRTTPFPN